MTVKVFSGVKMSATHTYDHVTLFNFICDGKIMRIMEKDQAIFLPTEAIREIICEREDDDSDIIKNGIFVAKNGVEEKQLMFYYNKSEEDIERI